MQNFSLRSTEKKIKSIILTNDAAQKEECISTMSRILIVKKKPETTLQV